MRAADGQLIGVCSQEQDEIDKAQTAWGIDFPILADPQCFIAGVLKERAGLDLYIDRDKWTVGDMKGHRSYQVGMYEPGVCAVRQDLTKLYSWALKPTAANTGGAMGRVHAADAWKAIQLSLSGDFSLADWEPEYTLEGKPRMNGFMFKLITLAEGNFIRPLGMELPEDGGVGEGHETGASHFATVRRKNMRKVAAAGLVSVAALWKKPLPAAVLLALYGTLLSPNPRSRLRSQRCLTGRAVLQARVRACVRCELDGRIRWVSAGRDPGHGDDHQVRATSEQAVEEGRACLCWREVFAAASGPRLQMTAGTIRPVAQDAQRPRPNLTLDEREGS